MSYKDLKCVLQVSPISSSVQFNNILVLQLIPKNVFNDTVLRFFFFISNRVYFVYLKVNIDMDSWLSVTNPN